MKSLRLTLGLAVIALLATAIPARASMIGFSIEATAFFPTIGGATTGGPVTAVVGAGTEFSTGQFGSFFGPSFDFADTTITITHLASGHQGATFNGYQFFDVNSAIASFTAFTVISDSTGFFSGDPSRLTFDGNRLFVNFQGLSFPANTLIVLGVQTAQTVPEPGTLVLLGTGIAAAVAVRRRKQLTRRQ